MTRSSWCLQYSETTFNIQARVECHVCITDTQFVGAQVPLQKNELSAEMVFRMRAQVTYYMTGIYFMADHVNLLCSVEAQVKFCYEWYLLHG